MKSFLVIGLGSFGKHLAMELVKLGNDVVVVDRHEKSLDELSGEFTDSYIGDCRSEDVLRSLGINNFDACFVCIRSDFQSSLEITSMLSENGAEKTVALALSDRQAALLKKIGADEVIYPEKSMAERTALRYDASNIVDVIKITGDYSIYEIVVPQSWCGKTIIQLDIRKVYKVNIIAVKNGDTVTAAPAADYLFKPDDHVMLVGTESLVEKIR